MKQIIKYLSIGLCTLLVGCGSRDFESSLKDAGTEYTEGAIDDTPIEIERKLIKEGWLSFETLNMESTRKTILNALEIHNGYISNDNEYTNSNRISNTIIVRVPTDKFDIFLSDATIGVEQFENKNISVRDVTAEFLDVETRLTTKKEIELRYIALLQKTETISEILEVEKQLGELRSDIESIEGRLKLLENQVSLSTLSITFYQSLPSHHFENGISNGWHFLILFLVALVNMWPFLLIGLMTLTGIRVYRRRKKKRN